MSEFDPYLKWLGIRTSERPPNHYQLLGLVEFESDTDVIAASADRQMVHVRTFQHGEHAETSQRVLNELALARRQLMNNERRQAYDAQLTLSRQKKSANTKKDSPPTDEPANIGTGGGPPRVDAVTNGASRPALSISPETEMKIKVAAHDRGKPKKNPYLIPIAILIAMLVVAVPVLFWVVKQSTSQEFDDYNASLDPSAKGKTPSAVVSESNKQNKTDSKTNKNLAKTKDFKGQSKSPSPEKQKKSKNKKKSPGNASPFSSPLKKVDNAKPSNEGKEPVSSKLPPSKIVQKFIGPFAGSRELIKISSDLAKENRQGGPKGVDLRQAEKVYEELYGKRLEDARDNNAVLELAVQLRSDAVSANQHFESTGDQGSQDLAFVMFVQSIELSSGIDELAHTIQTINSADEIFDFDGLKKCEAFLKEHVRHLPDSLNTDAHFLKVLDEYESLWKVALQRKEFRIAGRLVSAVEKLVKARYRDPIAAEKMSVLESHIREIGEMWAKFQASIDVLKNNPEDAEALGNLGKFQCFVEFDFESGLKSLAKCDDSKLSSCAKLELETRSGAVSAKTLIKVAEKWAQAGKDGKKFLDHRIKMHVADLFAEALNVADENWPLRRKYEDSILQIKSDVAQFQTSEVSPYNRFAFLFDHTWRFDWGYEVWEQTQFTRDNRMVVSDKNGVELRTVTWKLMNDGNLFFEYEGPIKGKKTKLNFLIAPTSSKNLKGLASWTEMVRRKPVRRTATGIAKIAK